MDELRCVSGWSIHVQELHDVLSSYRATATRMHDYDWATGIDAEMALVNLAAKIGLDKNEVLRAFGL